MSHENIILGQLCEGLAVSHEDFNAIAYACKDCHLLFLTQAFLSKHQETCNTIDLTDDDEVSRHAHPLSTQSTRPSNMIDRDICMGDGVSRADWNGWGIFCISCDKVFVSKYMSLHLKKCLGTV